VVPGPLSGRRLDQENGAIVVGRAGVGLLAEQIVIDCAPSTLEDLFCHRRTSWLEPLLRLAGDEGEAAGLVLLGERGDGDRRQTPRRRTHEVEVRPVDQTAGRTFRVGLQWRTTDYRALFKEFTGTLEVRPLDDHTVVSVEGVFAAPASPGVPAIAALATRRAAESAVRSLLGHLRSAVEERSLATR
jgi:hypothetical protein